MDVDGRLTDDAVLAELGTRLTTLRLSADLTQAELAHDAGVSKRTVERMEAGESAQMTSFIRVLRSLGRLEGLDLLLPAAEPTPMDLLRREGKVPRRASGRREGEAEPWSWADED